jgi:hypothetical protein
MGNPHKGNHNRPENGIQKCKKAGLKPPLSCEIQYAIEITYPRGSAASVFFTEDYFFTDLNAQATSPGNKQFKLAFEKWQT